MTVVIVVAASLRAAGCERQQGSRRFDRCQLWIFKVAPTNFMFDRFLLQTKLGASFRQPMGTYSFAIYSHKMADTSSVCVLNNFYYYKLYT